MYQTRQSNIELLRIIAIAMVVMSHFYAKGLHPEALSGCSACFSWSALEDSLIKSLCVVAVNIFVLISGYFSINLSYRSVFNLYLRCLLIGLITYIVYILISGEQICASILAGRFLAFSHNNWWFVISYLGLMIVSPLLNAGCLHIDKKIFRNFILLFTLVVVYFGWWRYQEQTYHGYSLIHFIYLYVLARYIRLNIPLASIHIHRWLWLGMYIAISIGLSLLPYITTHAVFTYDNPFVIASSVCLLLFFLSIPLKDQATNIAAASVFSAYLIQESPFFGHKWLYPFYEELVANESHGVEMILIIVFSFATVLGSVLIDKLCIIPVINWTNRFIK